MPSPIDNNTTHAPSRGAGRRRLTRWAIGLLLIACLAALLLFYKEWQHADAHIVDVHTVAQQTLVDELLLEGRVINDQTVRITALIDGEITEVVAREGAVVKAGDPLASIDDDYAQASFKRARAKHLMESEALDAQGRRYQRVQRLAESASVTEQELDAAESEFLRLEAALDAAAADLDAAQLQINNADIHAPFNGTVISQQAEVGQWVEAGTELFVIVGEAGFVVEAYVDAEHLQTVKPAQAVTLETEIAADRQWQSEVSWLSPTIGTLGPNNEFPNSFAIRIPLPGDDAIDGASDGQPGTNWLLGQQVDVNLVLSQREDVLTVPLTALVERPGGQVGVWVDDGGHAAWRAIDIGLVTTQHAEVREGLAENENVLIAGSSPLTEGVAIRQRNAGDDHER